MFGVTDTNGNSLHASHPVQVFYVICQNIITLITKMNIIVSICVCAPGICISLKFFILQQNMLPVLSQCVHLSIVSR